MALCELVGGPRDGERFTVPGAVPPEFIRIVDKVGALQMWHPAMGPMAEARVVLCKLRDFPEGSAWRYTWGRAETPG